jgi:hypothetical protein
MENRQPASYTGGDGRPAGAKAEACGIPADLSTNRKGATAMDFRPLNDTERTQLLTALRGNAERDRAILIDRRDTGFVGTTDDVTDDEVIMAIQSVPCHY